MLLEERDDGRVAVFIPFAMDSGVNPPSVARSNSAPLSNNNPPRRRGPSSRRQTAASGPTYPPDRPPRCCPATAAPPRCGRSADDEQRRPTLLRRPVDLRAFVQQQPRRVDAAFLASTVQRRPPFLVRPIDLRAFLQQQPRRVDVAVLAGDKQRRHTVLRRPIDLRAFCPATAAPRRRGRRCRRCTAASCRPASARSTSAPSPARAAPRRRGRSEHAMNSGVRPSVPRPIDLRAFLQQQPRRVDVALLAGDVQRRPPSFVARSTSAPLSSSSRTASTWPFSQAMPAAQRRRIQSSTARSTSAPLSSAARAASTWPFVQAPYSGVSPSFVARSTSAPLSSNSRAASTWPFSHARTAASRRPSPGRPPRLCPATAAPRRRGLLAGDEQRRPAVLLRPINMRRRCRSRARRSRRPTRPLIDLRTFVQQQPRHRTWPTAAAAAWCNVRLALSRPVDLRAVVQQQPRRVDVALQQAANSGVRRPSSPGRPPRLCPATAAPRRRGPPGRRQQRRPTVLFRPVDLRRRYPATAAPRRRDRSGRHVQRPRRRSLPAPPAPMSSSSRARRRGAGDDSGVRRSPAAPTPLSSNSRGVDLPSGRRYRAASTGARSTSCAVVQQQPRRVDVAVLAGGVQRRPFAVLMPPD